MMNIRRSGKRLISIEGNPILVRRHLYNEGPFSFHGGAMSEAMGEYVTYVMGPVKLDIGSQIEYCGN